jgi:lysophospholipase L1-like esterase
MAAVERPPVVKPGLFGVAAAADNRRVGFDLQNEMLLVKGLPVDAVFIGDSITDLWLLDAFFQGTGGFLVNRGIGGDRSPFMRRRFDADVVQLRPRLAVIKIGVNNTWDLDYWLNPELRRTPEEIEEEIVADVTAVTVRAREQGIITALCSILPTHIPVNAHTARRNSLIVHANRRIAEIADRLDAIYVDYHSQLVDVDGSTLRPGLADDGLHPHVLGYEIMADVLLQTLARHGITTIERRTHHL